MSQCIIVPVILVDYNYFSNLFSVDHKLPSFLYSKKAKGKWLGREVGRFHPVQQRYSKINLANIENYKKKLFPSNRCVRV